jgi:hypothetical protein
MKLLAFDVAFRAVQRGYTADEIRPCLTHDLGGGYFEVDVEHAAYPRTAKDGFKPSAGLRNAANAMVVELGIVSDKTQPPAPSGPGAELHALLRDWLGVEPTKDCPCRSMAAKMDRLGPDWCEGEGMAEILGVMRAEHAKRWSQKKTILPWVEAGAKQLILLACRRARSVK